ncbi:MAG: hypothetical protein N3E37_00345 [Candidatus Micrarchaeota archaeon]|nr:hypothetical protein [Candidatus Micrarchaeota archaeon]
MHVCVKCGKKYEDLNNVEKSCDCGCTVFLYMIDQEKDTEEKRLFLKDKLRDYKLDEGKLYSIDVANIKILQKGVYEIDIESLLNNPVVIKDQHGIYYVKLPKRKKRQ